MNYHLTAVIWEEDGVYVSKCPELELASCGDTPQEAKKNLMEAVELYLENARLLGILEDVSQALTTENKFSSSFEVAA
jgi:predicted RNase H-like HicB family nuclease